MVPVPSLKPGSPKRRNMHTVDFDRFDERLARRLVQSCINMGGLWFVCGCASLSRGGVYLQQTAGGWKSMFDWRSLLERMHLTAWIENLTLLNCQGIFIFQIHFLNDPNDCMRRLFKLFTWREHGLQHGQVVVGVVARLVCNRQMR